MIFSNKSDNDFCYRHRFGTATLIPICQVIKKGSEETPQNPYIYYISIDYSITVATLPEPTVRPPSLLLVLIFYVVKYDKIRLLSHIFFIKSTHIHSFSILLETF
jgi:hypothetical protein